MFKSKGKFAPFKTKVWLASPTMHGDEMRYMSEAYETNWMSTVGANIDEVERIAAEQAGVKYAVALSNCTAALHLCAKLAGEKLYGKPEIGHGALEGKRVFCSDMTFAATLNPVVYEGAIPVFIDTEAESWNMDPVALEKAFEIYPDVKLVVCAELYGFSGNIRKIKEICENHGALLMPCKTMARLCYKHIYKYDEMSEGFKYCYWITPAKFRSGLFDASFFSEPVDIPFEDTVLYGSKKIKEYLAYRYGDYMKLPSKEAQKAAVHAMIFDVEKRFITESSGISIRKSAAG